MALPRPVLLPVTSRMLPDRRTQLVLQVRNEGWRPLKQIVVAIETNEVIQSSLGEVVVSSLAAGDATRLHFPVTVAMRTLQATAGIAGI